MKKRKNFVKKLAAVALGFVMTLGVGAAGYAASAAETHAGAGTDVLFAKGFGGYTTSSYSAAGTDRTGLANTDISGVTYALQSFNGSNGQVRGNSSGAANFNARNTTTQSGYYISQVSLTIKTGTIDGSTSGRSVVYFGSSAFGNPSTAPTGTYVSASPSSSGQTTLTWSNNNKSFNYFLLYGLKTSGSAYSESESTALKVTWAQAASKTLKSVAVSGTPTKLTYTVGDSFDPAGLTVTGTYDDASQETLTGGIEWTCTPANFSSVGSQSVSVTAKVGNISSQSYTVSNITVQAPPPIITITRDSFTDAQGYGTPSSWTQSNVSGKAEIYGTENTKMQFNKGASSGHGIGGIWNTTPVPGAITKISATTASGTNRKWDAWVYSSACSYGTSFVDGQNKTKINNSTVTIGTSETNIGTSTAGYSYFFIQCNENSASYISEFKIYYEAAQEYSVTATLSHCSSNGEPTCNTGQDYKATITPDTYYDLVSITNVKSNNVSLTKDTDYKIEGNTLTVYKAAIRGNITFSATGDKSEKTVGLSSDSVGVTLTGASTIPYCDSYSATIAPKTGYNLPLTITVTIGSTTLTNGTDYNWNSNTGALSINSGKITGNVVIKAVATLKTYSVDRSELNNISYAEDSGSSTQHGGEFSATLSTSQGWTLNDVTITVSMEGGGTISYNPSNHKVTSSSVTGDITISGSAIEVVGPSIELSKYESEFEYLSSDTVSLIVANATVTSIDSRLSDGDDVAEFELYEDCETINISSIDSGLGYYNLTVYYQDNGGVSGSKTINDFGVQVNRHTALSFSLTNATSDQSSTTSYDYGDEFDIVVTPNQYYTLEEGDITVLADGDDITDTVTVIDSDEALISLEDEYDSVSITVNATRLPAYVTRIDITTPASTLSFNVGATFNHNGIVITGTNNDGTSAGIVTSLCSFSSPDMLNAGQKTVTITLVNSKGENVTTSYTITITETALLDGGLSSCGWTSSQEQSTVYDDLELTQSNVGTWALSSGEQYSNSTMFVLGDYKTSHGAWNNFSSHENMKSLANGLVKNNLVLKQSGNPIGRYGAIITKDFNISRFYKAEIAWGAFISGGTNNNVYIMGTKDGGVTWDKLAEKTKVSAGASAADTLTWNNTSKYSANDKVFIAIVYTAESEVATTNSPAMRNLTWKLYGDALNKNQTWNAYDFTLSKTSSSLKVGENETLSVTSVPTFAQDTFTWSSSDTSKATVDDNGKVTAVGVTGEKETVTITATSSQGVEKSCSYTIGPADIHVTGVSIKYNNVVVTSDSIQERSTRTYVADVQPADATDKSVTWSISEISPAGCASINSSTGEVTASAEGSAKITVTTTDGSKSASCVITITAYPSYNVVYKAGDGTGDDITDKVDYDKDTTARLANTFTAPNGKKFDHWLGSDTNTYDAGAAISKLSSGSTLTLTAVYVSNTYTITYLDQGGNAYSGSTISSPTSYTYGVGATLPTVTKSGFSFGGWYAESACSGSPVTSISTSDYGNKTFYAKWTFNAEDGLNSVQKSIGLAYTYSNTLTPAKDSYQKITSTSDLTLGKYLIVYESENGNKAFNGALEADAAGNNISVNISNGEIASTTETNAAAVTIDPTDGSILNSLETKYIGHTGSSNSLNYKNKSSGAYDNEISFENGNVKFENGAYQLKFNSGDNRFRYYKSGQESIALYKYVNQAAKTYSNVDFRFNFKFKGIATFAEANHVDSDYGLVISYSGRTRYFSVKNKQVLENGKDNVSLNYKETGTDEGYFTIRLGIKGDVMNYLEQSQIKYKVQVYTQDSAGNKYTSDTFVEFSVQSMIEQYYNDPRYCTQAVKDLYAIFGPTAKEE